MSPPARADHREIIDTTGQIREQVGNLDPALAVLAKFPAAAEQTGVFLNELILRVAEFRRPRLSVEFVQEGLGVEGLEMAWAAGHEQEDHGLGLGLGQMRRLRCERIDTRRAQAVGLEDRSKRHAAEAAESAADKLPSSPGDGRHGNHVSPRTGRR